VRVDRAAAVQCSFAAGGKGSEGKAEYSEYD